jgi:hypothetical protein
MGSEDLPLMQELSDYGVRITREIAHLTVAGMTFKDLERGSQITLPMWAAEVLIGAGIAEPIEGRLEVQRLAQLLWREKRSISELVNLPPKFYHALRHSFSSLSGADAESAKALRLYARDLVSLRLSKLLGYAAKGVEPELIQHMTEEERELYVRLRSLIKAWLQSLGLEV